MLSRRTLLAGSAGLVASEAFAAAPPLARGLPSGVADVAEMEALAGKKPLIKLAYRPPNYETPASAFTDAITPNDMFFVRYHLSDIPVVDVATWRLNIVGKSPLLLSLADLKRYPPVEIAAVCQCSGNRRGLSNPHVTGVQWGYGAMGCARWKGARLKDVLAEAGIPDGALELVANGADGPPVDKTPDFVKSLPMWKALDENTLIAYEMNGEPLPHFNGAPARLVVPGWTATYWVKHLTHLSFVDRPFDGFWVKSAYRIPVGLFPSVDRFVSQETATTTPITDMVVNSLIVAPGDGARVKAGPLEISGVAWDGGRGVDRVEISLDGGQSWRPAALGPDLGRFAFRVWRFDAEARGPMTILSRASNVAGQTQVGKALFNPAGYHHNVINSASITLE
jgi:DMSO/TMAO reductase YedYZ molybdopterin-dependent catalytic subunit